MAAVMFRSLLGLLLWISTCYAMSTSFRCDNDSGALLQTGRSAEDAAPIPNRRHKRRPRRPAWRPRRDRRYVQPVENSTTLRTTGAVTTSSTSTTDV
eukprot:s138_g16.t1